MKKIFCFFIHLFVYFIGINSGSCQVISIDFTIPNPAKACGTDTTVVEVKNSGTSGLSAPSGNLFMGVILNSTRGESIAGLTPYTSYLNSGGGTVNLTAGERLYLVDLLVASLSSQDSITRTYSYTLDCQALPDGSNITTFPDRVPGIFYVNAGTATQLRDPDTLQLNGATQISNIINYPVSLPFLTLDPGRSNANPRIDPIDFISGNAGRRLVFVNTGAEFSGTISVFDSIACNRLEFAQATLSAGTLTQQINPNASSYGSAIVMNITGLASGDSIVLEEIFTTDSILNFCVNDCGSRNFITRFTYGCSPGDLCKGDTITNTQFLGGLKIPQLNITRRIPAPNSGNLADPSSYWDTGLATDTVQRFEFVLRNDGTDATSDIALDVRWWLLNNFSHSLFYITDSTQLGLTSLPAFRAVAGLPAHQTNPDSIIHAFRRWSTQLAAPWPDCLQNNPQAIQRADFHVDYLLPGDSLAFFVNILPCCPAGDTGGIGNFSFFNTSKELNKWAITNRIFRTTCPGEGVTTIPSDDVGGFAFALEPSGGISLNPVTTANDLYLDLEYFPTTSDIDIPNNPVTCQDATGLNCCSQPFQYPLQVDLAEFNRSNASFPYNLASASIFSPTYRPNLRDSMHLSGGLHIELELDPGLFLDASNTLCSALDSVVFLENNQGERWLFDQQSANCQVRCGTGEPSRYSFDFLFQNCPGGDSIGNVYPYLNASAFHFFLKGCCDCMLPGESFNPRYSIRVFAFGRDSGDCHIPMAEVSSLIQLHCPGCILPGPIITGASRLLQRTSFGLTDPENDGRLSTTSVPASATTPGVGLNRSIPGDTLLTVLEVTINGQNLTGIPPAQMGLDHVYLELLIPCSQPDSFDVSIFSLTFQEDATCTTGTCSTTLTPADPAWSDLVIDRRTTLTGSPYYFIDFSPAFWPAVFNQIGPADHYRITIRYAICGNVHTLNGVSQSRFESFVQAFLYFTGEDLKDQGIYNAYQSGVRDLATELYSDTAPSVFDTSWLYVCEVRSGFHYFFPINHSLLANIRDFGLTATDAQFLCNKAIQIITRVEYGDGDENPFPFEIRSPRPPDLLTITLPGDTGTYELQPLSGRSFSTMRVYDAGICQPASEYTVQFQRLTMPAATYLGANTWELNLGNVFDQVDSSRVDTLNCNGSFAADTMLLVSDEYYKSELFLPFRFIPCNQQDTDICRPDMLQTILPTGACAANVDTLRSISTATTVTASNPLLQASGAPASTATERSVRSSFNLTNRYTSGRQMAVEHLFVALVVNPYLQLDSINGLAPVHDTLNGQFVQLVDLGTLTSGSSLQVNLLGQLLQCDNVDRRIRVFFGWDCRPLDTLQVLNPCFLDTSSWTISYTGINLTARFDPQTRKGSVCDSIGPLSAIFTSLNGGVRQVSLLLEFPGNPSFLSLQQPGYFQLRANGTLVPFTLDTLPTASGRNGLLFALADSLLPGGDGALDLGDSLQLSFSLHPVCYTPDTSVFRVSLISVPYCDPASPDTLTTAPDSWTVLGWDSLSSGCSPIHLEQGPLCALDPPGLLTASLPVDSGAALQFVSPYINDPFQGDPVALFNPGGLTSGNYPVQVFYYPDSASNCFLQSVDSVTIGICGLSVSPSRLICPGTSVQLSADTGFVTYQWLAPGGTLVSSLREPVVAPNTTTVYTVIATTAGGLTSSATTTVQVLPNLGADCCVPSDFVPGTDFSLANTTISAFAAAAGWGSSVSTANKILINGTLTIDQDFTFNNCEHIIMGPNAVIHINPGVRLDVLTSHVYSCGPMWQSIEAPPTARLKVSDSFIEDGLAAIRSWGAPALVEVLGNYFDANKTAVELFDGLFQNASFYGNHFLCTRYIKPASNLEWAAHHIYLHDAENVQVGGFGKSANHFYDAIRGIYALRSKVSVQNNVFGRDVNPDAKFGVYATGYPTGSLPLPYHLSVGNAASNSFSDLHVGVYAANHYDLNVFGNTFQNNRIGVSVFRCDERTIDIRENTITLSKNPGYGIQLQNNHQAMIQVRKNQVNDISTPFDPATEGGVGILVNNSVQSLSSLYLEENEIAHCATGIRVMNQNGGVVASNQVSYAVPDAWIDLGYGYRNGLQAQACNNLDISYNTVLRDCQTCSDVIGQPEFFRGITSDLTTAAHIHDNYLIKAPQGILVRRESAGGYYNCNYFSGGNVGFNFDLAQIDPQGGPTNTTDNQWVNYSGGRLKIAGELDPGGAVDWFFDLSLGTSYDPNPFDPDVVIPQNGISDNTCSQFPPYIDPQVSILRLINDSAYAEHLFEKKLFDRKAAYGLLHDSLQLLYQGTVHDVELQNFFNLYALSNQGYLKDIEDHLINNETAQAAILNLGLVPSNLHEANSVAVNQIVIESSGDSVYYNLGQKQDLLAIAYQNPVIGGEAVYRARAILRLDLEDMPIGFRSTGSGSRENVVYCSPNPTSGQLLIACDNPMVNGLHMEIYSMIGEKLISNHVLIGRSMEWVNLEWLPAGVYVAKFIGEGVNFSERIILNR